MSKKRICIETGLICGLMTGILVVSTPADSCNHHYEWRVTEEASHYHEGKMEKRCTKCGEIFEKQIIPQEEHNYEDCVCECGSRIDIDKEAHTIMLTKDMYTQAGLPVSGEVVIPEEIQYDGEMYKVVGLGRQLFEGNKDIISITMPDTVKVIQAYCFNECTNLRQVKMPQNLKSIDMAAFQCCSSLEQINLPDSLEYIGGFGFNHCSNVQNSEINIGPNLKCIGNAVDVPAHMFYDCGKDGIFTSFSVDKNNPMYQEIDGILYTKDGKTMVSIPRGKVFEDNTYIMPDSVINLGELSFSKNMNINTVVISDNLVIDGELLPKERLNYNNYGNILSRSIYVYCPVSKYLTKDTNTKYKSIDGVLYTKDGLRLIAVPNKYEGELNIPEGVTKWQKEAIWSEVSYFKEYGENGQIYSKISKISIPSTLVNIEEVQISTINEIAGTYGTKIEVAEGNPKFYVDDSGMLKIR